MTQLAVQRGRVLFVDVVVQERLAADAHIHQALAVWRGATRVVLNKRASDEQKRWMEDVLHQLMGGLWWFMVVYGGLWWFMVVYPIIYRVSTCFKHP